MSFRRKLKWAGIAALVSAGSCIATYKYLGSSYKSHKAEREIAEKTIDALFTPEQDRNTFTKNSYLESLGAEYFRQLKGCELKEFSILASEDTGNGAVLYYKAKIYDGKRESVNIGTLVVRDGKIVDGN